MMRVDDQIARVRRIRRRTAAQQKVPGKVDALDVDAGAPRDLHVDERQRDRNAGAPIEHVVQEAVARILVLDVVADEPLLVEQVVVERGDARERLRIDVRGTSSSSDCGGGARAGGFAAEASSCSRYGPASSFGYATRAIISAATRQVGIRAQRRGERSAGRGALRSRNQDSKPRHLHHRPSAASAEFMPSMARSASKVIA